MKVQMPTTEITFFNEPVLAGELEKSFKELMKQDSMQS